MSVDWVALAKEEGFLDDKKAPLSKKKVVARKDAKVKPEIISWSSDKKTIFDEGKKEFRNVPLFPDYFISKDGVVRNVDGQILRRKVTSSDSQISLRVGIKNRNFYKFTLVHSAFPELAPVYHDDFFVYEGEAWRYVDGFPGYAISTSGRVLRLKNFTLLTNSKGRVYMSVGDRQISRSYRRLSLENFNVLPGDIKYLPHSVKFAITRGGKIVNLTNLSELSPNTFGSTMTKIKVDGEYKHIFFNVKELLKEHFGN